MATGPSKPQDLPRPQIQPQSKFTGTKANGVGELDWTGRLAGGLAADVARRRPLFASDWTDAFRPENVQLTCSSILFLFFGALTPTLGFGDAMSRATDEQLGVVETMLSAALSGLIYAVFAGQPLCIQGSTGPELAYTLVFYELCSALDIEFLPARAWQGLWCALFTVVLAVTDCCALMQLCTRFIEDIFAALICSIFAIAPLKTFLVLFANDAAQDNYHDTMFLWILICLMTYLTTMKLRHLQSTNLFNEAIRTTLANFAVPISIVVFSGIANVWRDDVEIKWLNVPETFEPTWTNPETGKVRPWFVNPMGINEDFPTWAIFFMIIPAMGLTLLGFFDQNLTTIIINRPSNGLKKPGGYHLDLLVCGACIYPMCALLGLPFPHNSTAPSLIHLISLTKFEEEELPGGGRVKKASHVVEQRFTNFAIHFLIGCALKAAPLLKFVPTSVTSGMFLVMAVTSMRGNQLFERWHLWFIFDRSAYPKYHYVTGVEESQLRKFTIIQVVCFVIILLFTELLGPIGEIFGNDSIKMVSVIFPFLLGSLVLVREALHFMFTMYELSILDPRGE